MASELTEKRERFCEEYLIDLNATQAAIRAGYSEASARQIASELLTNDDIQTYLSIRQKELQQVTGITQERVLNEFAKIAFADIRNYFKDGKLIKVDELCPESAAALSSIKIYEDKADGIVVGSIKEIKLADKLKALEGLGRHLGLFNDKLTILDRLPEDQLNELYEMVLKAADSQR